VSDTHGTMRSGWSRSAVRTLTGALLVFTVMPTMALAQDAVAGKAVFTQCAMCHALTQSNGIGPGLQGIDGRKVGSAAGFRYSSAMAAVTYSWDAKSLDAFLTSPTKAIPGSAMPFAGLPDAKQRADVIAYMQTLK
jgi:cytochrome c